ncbi:hypothetical protein [Streptomyces noursei]|uniref:hypothetical protein n=1 Tax=Streptomyces noursei TaxID=1971 RepID=UPI003821ECEB
MSSMRAVLERREKAALMQVEKVRAEFERARAALAEAEEVLNHRVIGLEQYLEALDEQDAPAVAETSGLAAAEAPAEEPVPMAGPPRKVTRCEEGVPVEVLGPDYRRITVALDEAGGDALTARPG